MGGIYNDPPVMVGSWDGGIGCATLVGFTSSQTGKKPWPYTIGDGLWHWVYHGLPHENSLVLIHFYVEKRCVPCANTIQWRPAEPCSQESPEETQRTRFWTTQTSASWEVCTSPNKIQWRALEGFLIWQPTSNTNGCSDFESWNTRTHANWLGRTFSHIFLWPFLCYPRLIQSTYGWTGRGTKGMQLKAWTKLLETTSHKAMTRKIAPISPIPN